MLYTVFFVTSHMSRWFVQNPQDVNPSVLDVPSWSSWLTLDDQNALHWAYVDRNVKTNMLFYPTYFCSNPDTTDKYITFKGWQLTVNTETLAPDTFTEAKASGSLRFRNPSATYFVTVQHVCHSSQNSLFFTPTVTFKAKLQSTLQNTFYIGKTRCALLRRHRNLRSV